MPWPELPASVPEELWPGEVPRALLPLSLENGPPGAKEEPGVADLRRIEKIEIR